MLAFKGPQVMQFWISLEAIFITAALATPMTAVLFWCRGAKFVTETPLTLRVVTTNEPYNKVLDLTQTVTFFAVHDIF